MISNQTAGFVLAGGQSSRMGSDKALAELAGEPLIVHAIRILRRAGLEVAIAGGRPVLAAYAPVVDDRGGGPLQGISHALASTGAVRAVFLPVDMPLVPPSLIGALVEGAAVSGAAAVSLSVGGFAETFPMVVDCALSAALRAEIEAGNAGARAAVRSAANALGRPPATWAAEALAQAGQVEHPAGLPPAFWFLNVNTPAQLKRAEAMLAAHRVI